MGLLVRIISNADVGDRMSHMVCDLGLAEFPLPPCPMVHRRMMSGPLACSFPHRQFSQRNCKESMNPGTIFVSLGGLSLLISLNPSVQLLGSPGELTCLDSTPSQASPSSLHAITSTGLSSSQMSSSHLFFGPNTGKWC